MYNAARIVPPEMICEFVNDVNETRRDIKKEFNFYIRAYRILAARHKKRLARSILQIMLQLEHRYNHLLQIPPKK